MSKNVDSTSTHQLRHPSQPPAADSSRDARRGFTIVELLIVIVVIGILAAITIVSYNGIQQRARNAARVSAIDQINKALQIYGVENGSYPKQGTVAGLDIPGNPETLLGLPQSVVVNPGAPAGTTDSISENQTGNNMSANSYGYLARDDGGHTCWGASSVCTNYTLWYKLEGETTAHSIIGP